MYTIKVSQNYNTLFEAEVCSSKKLQSTYILLAEKFPKSEGYHLDATYTKEVDIDITHLVKNNEG